jgi:hypothetical protein
MREPRASAGALDTVGPIPGSGGWHVILASVWHACDWNRTAHTAKTPWVRHPAEALPYAIKASSRPPTA